MLRYKTKLDLVLSPCTTSGHETEQVYSYNPEPAPNQQHEDTKRVRCMPLLKNDTKSCSQEQTVMKVIL